MLSTYFGWLIAFGEDCEEVSSRHKIETRKYESFSFQILGQGLFTHRKTKNRAHNRNCGFKKLLSCLTAFGDPLVAQRAPVDCTP